VSEITHYLCIGCPLGCRLEVETEDHEIIEVRGFGCRRGREYAEREHVDPRRMASSTVRVHGARWDRLPVRTDRPIPKDQVRAVCAALRAVEVTAPILMGQVILRNALGTGADIIATRDLPAEAEPPDG